jgi:hypothetical protein
VHGQDHGGEATDSKEGGGSPSGLRQTGYAHKVSVTRDLGGGVVADAVAFEPVSTVKFPANREINREFRRIRLLSAILKADTQANSEVCIEIPYSTEQGIFAKEQGILDCTPGGEQGLGVLD